MELAWRWNPVAGVSLSGHYTYLDADEPAGEEVKRPRHSGGLVISGRGRGGKLKVGAAISYQGAQLDNDFRNFFTTFAAERTELAGYTLVNLNASFELTDTVEVHARVENLLDEDYEESIGYTTPGAAVFAGIRIDI